MNEILEPLIPIIVERALNGEDKHEVIILKHLKRIILFKSPWEYSKFDFPERTRTPIDLFTLLNYPKKKMLRAEIHIPVVSCKQKGEDLHVLTNYLYLVWLAHDLKNYSARYLSINSAREDCYFCFKYGLASRTTIPSPTVREDIKILYEKGDILEYLI
jgi:hypothetical protein